MLKVILSFLLIVFALKLVTLNGLFRGQATFAEVCICDEEGSAEKSGSPKSESGQEDKIYVVHSYSAPTLPYIEAVLHGRHTAMYKSYIVPPKTPPPNHAHDDRLPV